MLAISKDMEKASGRAGAEPDCVSLACCALISSLSCYLSLQQAKLAASKEALLRHCSFTVKCQASVQPSIKAYEVAISACQEVHPVSQRDNEAKGRLYSL